MNSKLSKWLCAAMALLSLALAACSSLAKLSNQDVQKQLAEAQLKIPPAIIDRLGDWAFQIYLKSQSRSLLQNPQIDAQIKSVLDRLLAAAQRTQYAETVKAFNWEVKVIKDNSVSNAVAFPGGKIIVYSGLFDAKTDPEYNNLAVTLSHEIVHALERHFVERLDKEIVNLQKIAATRGQLKESDLSPEAIAAILAAMGIEHLTSGVPPFVRQHEAEADWVGLFFLALAGYHPQLAPKFWGQMKQDLAEKKMPAFLSAHASYEERIQLLARWAPVALRYYQKPAGSAPAIAGLQN